MLQLYGEGETIVSGIKVEIQATGSDADNVIKNAYDQAEEFFGHTDFDMKQYHPVEAHEKTMGGRVGFWVGTFVANGHPQNVDNKEERTVNG